MQASRLFQCKFTFLRKENQGFLTLLSIWLKSWNSNFWEPSDRSTDFANYFLSNNHTGGGGGALVITTINNSP